MLWSNKVRVEKELHKFNHKDEARGLCGEETRQAHGLAATMSLLTSCHHLNDNNLF